MSGYNEYVKKLSTDELKLLAEKYSSYISKHLVKNERILNRHSVLFNEMRSRGFWYDYGNGKYFIPTGKQLKIVYGKNERTRLLQMQ